MKYIYNIAKTGAVRKTPSRVINDILSELDRQTFVDILELGGGNGEITRKIIEKYSLYEKTNIVIIEKEYHYYNHLKYNYPSTTVLQEDAFNYQNYLNDIAKYDYIVSSIPLSFSSRENLHNLLKALKSALKPNGKIILLFHAFWIKQSLKEIFPNMNIKKYFTIPPYYLLVFENTNEYLPH